MASFTASIRERQRRDSTVVFDVRYRIEGRSKTLSFEDARSADRFVRLVRRVGTEQALTIMDERDSAAHVPSVNEWAERYISGLSGVEGKTTDHYRLYMRLSIGPAMGELPIDTVTSFDVARWINDQVSGAAGRVYASKTVKNRHGFLSAMLQAAVDDDIIRKNPCARSRLPESEAREMVFLSLEEYETILRCVPERDRLLVHLLAATGLRWGEVSALRPSDFDLRARTVRVSRAWKHSKDRGHYLGAPKSRRSRRTVSLPANLIPLLRIQLEERTEFVFTNRAGMPWRHTKFNEDHWKPAVRLANGQPAWPSKPRRGGVWDQPPSEHPIGKWPGIHSLRHSHASWLLADHVDPVTIQRRLGHESIDTTTAIYSHLSPDMLLRPADTMDRVLALNL